MSLSSPARLAQRLQIVKESAKTCVRSSRPVTAAHESHPSNHRTTFSTSCAQQTYQSRQSWQADQSPIMDRYRRTQKDFDKEMREAAETARGFILAPRDPTLPPAIAHELTTLRLPRAAQLTYLHPLRRPVTHHHLAADLQLRSYSVRNLELMADFSLRAAYYLNLPAKGPIPLPRITERWTVPRANFIFKKSQENFERVTLRRCVRVYDADPAAVAIWLGFVRRHAYYGVGFKANVWEDCGLDVEAEMDSVAERLESSEAFRERLDRVGARSDVVAAMEKRAHPGIRDPATDAAAGSLAPMGSDQYRNDM